MRKCAILLVALMAALLTFSTAVRADMYVPEFEPGNKWTYNVNLNMEGIVLAGEWTFEVEREEQVSGYAVYNVSLDGNGPATLTGLGAGNYIMEGFSLLRKSDLASVMENVHMNVSITFGTMDTYMDTFLNTSYDPPLNEFDFPINVGDSWSSTTTVTSVMTQVSTLFPTTTSSTTETQTTDFECLSAEKISVPAGEFHSYKIKMTNETGGYSYIFISKKTGYLVKMQMFEESGASLGSIKLASYSYTAPPGGDGGDILATITDYLWLIGIIVVIVVVLVVIAVIASKRSKMPPMEEGARSESEEQESAPPG
ncbi:MAG: hypothetical protein ACE5KV_09430 [Thermoplasmata archaeon]